MRTHVRARQFVRSHSQEFNKLFMSLLERCLKRSGPPLQDLVQGLFSGELSYVTTCLSCKKRSTKTSAFNELELRIGVSDTAQEHVCVCLCVCV
ncbi:unnamed protein product [Choristocarpus tenellus]